MKVCGHKHKPVFLCFVVNKGNIQYLCPNWEPTIGSLFYQYFFQGNKCMHAERERQIMRQLLEFNKLN